MLTSLPGYAVSWLGFIIRPPESTQLKIQIISITVRVVIKIAIYEGVKGKTTTGSICQK